MVLLVSTSAHAQSESAVASDEPESEVVVSSPEARFHIMTGELAASRSQPGLAAVEFLAALKTVPDPALAARAAGLALTAGDLGTAGAIAKRWLEIEPNNMDPREVLLALALQHDDVDAAYAQADAIVSGHAGGHDDGFQHLASLVARQNSHTQTTNVVLERLAQAYPNDAGVYYARGLLALRQEQIADAETAVREAVRLNPSKENTLLLVGVLVRSEKLDEADDLMDKLARKLPDERADLRMAYAKLLVESRQHDRARKQVERVLHDNPKDSAARYALAVFELNDGDAKAARKQFEALTQDTERGGDARFQLGRIAEREKRYEDALELYESVTTGPQALDAAVRYAAVLAQLDRIGEARAQLQRMRDQFPPLRERLLVAEGEMLLQTGHREEALAAYNEGLRQFPENDDLLYGRSLVFDQLGRPTDAEADLRSIIQAQPDDARALNALGYMLTNDSSNRLPEARVLIEKALVLQPDDPAIIDSLGWVNFKLGKAEEAKTLLAKALDITPDPEIAAHLGEVLWTLGQRDEAKAIWNQALKESPDHEVLNETIQRLSSP